MSVHDAAELLGVRPAPSEAEDVLTLGGLAMDRIGRVPVAGDRFVWQGVSIEVVDMDGRRVDKLLATAL
jgi:putative hemolysin